MATNMTQAILSKILVLMFLGKVVILLAIYLYVLSCGRFFMEKQVVGEFVRILKLSRTISIPLQLLQTVGIMIQNLESEHAICKLICQMKCPYLQLH